MPAALPFGMRLDTALHVLHVALPLFALVRAETLAGRAVAAFLLFFGAFSFLHDVMHGALGLPRRANDLLLTGLGVVIGVSGHGARQVHLRHHAHALAVDDLEGRGATVSLARSLLLGVPSYLALPPTGWRLAGCAARRWIAAEWLLVCVSAIVVAHSPTGRIALAVTAALQLTIPTLGAHLPHRPPAPLLAAARALAWTRSPLVLGLAFHAWHHAHPKIPTFSQPDAAVGSARPFHSLSELFA